MLWNTLGGDANYAGLLPLRNSQINIEFLSWISDEGFL